MRYAAANGFVLVTLDADFIELAAVLGSPPKLIWLCRGNQITEVVEQMLRDNAEAIAALKPTMQSIGKSIRCRVPKRRCGAKYGRLTPL
jgi:predicted nuclease of predicted toxin-antitoxin system